MTETQQGPAPAPSASDEMKTGLIASAVQLAKGMPELKGFAIVLALPDGQSYSQGANRGDAWSDMVGALEVAKFETIIKMRSHMENARKEQRGNRDADGGDVPPSVPDGMREPREGDELPRASGAGNGGTSAGGASQDS